MGVNLFVVPKKTVQNEMTCNLDRKKNGYKMSRKARTLLGIKDDASARLAIAGDDKGRVLIKAATEGQQSNALVSRISMINHKGIVDKLDTFGNHFEITDVKTEEGYYIMTPSDTKVNNAPAEDVVPTENDEQATFA